MQSPSCKIDIGHLEGVKNWSTWKFKASLLLRGMPGGLDAVNGTLEKPVKPTTSIADEISQYNTALDHYNKIDSSALLLLTANMSDETLQKIMRFNWSKEVWDELHRLFDGKSEDKSYALCMEFFGYCKDPSHDITTHVSKIKTIWSDLKTELMKIDKSELPDILLICKILDTLPEAYFSFKSSWMLMSKTDKMIENLITQLCAYERAIMNEGPEEALALLNSNKAKKKCGYCGKVGHKVRQCHKWKADGKPAKPENKQTSSNLNLILLPVTTDVNSMLMNYDASSWFVDNGATSHVTCRNDFFSSFEHFIDSRTVTTANGATVKAIGKGTLDLKTVIKGKESRLRLCDVWYVPDIMRNLFSVLATQDRLNNSVFMSEREHCSLKVDGHVILTGKRTKNGGLYKLNVETITKSIPDLNALSTDNILQLYHERLAHQNKKHVKGVIERELGIKVRLDSELCTGCIYGKTHRQTFGTRERAKEPAEIIHADVCGPFQPSFNKFRYFVLFKDDFSKYRHVYFLRQKSEVHLKLRQMLHECKVAGHSVKEFLSDNGGEFDSENVRCILRKAGIRQRLTMPYTPQQNGLSERENRTLVEAARTMMHAHEELPLATWAELINTAAYVLNRSGPTPENGKSPFELWFKKKPAISHLKIIGCECYAHIPQQKRAKLSKKAEKCILIGYDGDEGYRLLKPPMCNAREDDRTENRSDRTASSTDEPRLVVPSTSPDHVESQEKGSQDRGMESFQPSSEASLPGSPFYEDALDDDDDDDTEAPRNNVDDIAEIATRMTLWDRSKIRQPDRFEDYVMMSADDVNEINEPKTYKEAISSRHKDQWVKAMENEVKSLKENKTWILVDLPKDRKPISCKWTIGFKQSDTDPCMFIRNRESNKIILALYVDDGLVAATNQENSEKFIRELKRRFKITIKDASYFLGLEIKNQNGDIKVSQKHYALKVLDHFGMSDCKPVTAPILKVGLPDLDKEVVDPTSFPNREAVGALAYLTVGTRPDLAYAISVVSRTLENPSKEDIQKLKRILRYIKGTSDYGITFKKRCNAGILECNSNSDHGGDRSSGRSTSGILCLYSGGAISWASRRQTCVAISSTEAELVAASEAAREIVWIKRLFGEISELKDIPELKGSVPKGPHKYLDDNLDNHAISSYNFRRFTTRRSDIVWLKFKKLKRPRRGEGHNYNLQNSSYVINEWRLKGFSVMKLLFVENGWLMLPWLIISALMDILFGLVFLVSTLASLCLITPTTHPVVETIVPKVKRRPNSVGYYSTQGEATKLGMNRRVKRVGIPMLVVDGYLHLVVLSYFLEIKG
ncbi:hypothetical protein MSG28_003756 [Choristoneura fumiferana]|uniref:Uncharacterized protein n=1 Tax=Choristoneura fumiferana TaxID=7141 RepID=A0ACC0KG34_CHOFU|nr:hypothetical protein MSG28_003756 [Choristoneura fumiferana]